MLQGLMKNMRNGASGVVDSWTELCLPCMKSVDPEKRRISQRGELLLAGGMLGDVEDIEANTKVAESHCRESNRWGKPRVPCQSRISRVAKISEMRTEIR